MREYSIKKDYSQRIPTCFWVAIGLVAIATLIHFTIEPKTPVAHAETGVETKSDRQQEVAYCKAWNKSQTQVSGATNMQIARHCSQYL